MTTRAWSGGKVRFHFEPNLIGSGHAFRLELVKEPDLAASQARSELWLGDLVAKRTFAITPARFRDPGRGWNNGRPSPAWYSKIRPS
jgi:hypothetical protein